MPSLFECVSRVKLVSSWITLTRTLETTPPLGSVTVPTISAAVDWADTVRIRGTRAKAASKRRLALCKVRIPFSCGGNLKPGFPLCHSGGHRLFIHPSGSVGFIFFSNRAFTFLVVLYCRPQPSGYKWK